MSLVLPLYAIREGDRARVGGKAAGCAALRRMGLAVPDGFALTTEAFDLLWEASGLREGRDQLFDLFRIEKSGENLRRHCAAFQEKIRRAALSPEVSESLFAAFRKLKSPVAVRSSATAEDAEASAFAGVFHSVLRVSEEGLLGAVQTCWAEAYDYTAITHALRKNIDPAGIRFALLVQEMVEADRSGVLFTQDPSGADPESALLSVTSGVGDALLQGEVEGEEFRLNRARPKTDDPLFSSLLRTGLTIERELGHPQDIEWACRGEKTWFLQARPITTIEPRREKPIYWTREISEERFPTAISPLGWSALRVVLSANHKTLANRFGLVAKHPGDIARTIRHYVYTNREFFQIPGSLRPNPLKHLRFLPRYLKGALDLVALAPVMLFRGKKIGFRFLATTRIFNAFLFTHAREIHAEWIRELPGMLVEMDACTEADLESMDTAGLRRHYDRMERVADRYMEPDIAIYVVKVACSWLMEKLGERLHGEVRPDFVADLTSGLEENRTLVMNAELEELHERFQEDPGAWNHLLQEEYDRLDGGMKPETAKALARFIERNGHMTTNWDIKEPTWGETPEKIFALLRSYGRAGNRRSFQNLQEERTQRAASALEKVMNDLSPFPWLQRFFTVLHRTLLDFMQIDEEHHFYCSRLFKPMRKFCAEAGNRLARAGALEDPEDIFYMTLPEVFGALEEKIPFPRRYLVEARRADFARSLAVRPPDRFRDQAPLPVDEMPVGAGSGEVRGIGASPGIATGIVRVVEREEQAAQFQEGEILVTATPNPAWTPMYAVASGLITSTGSRLSHGLVSAREYHLPAVIGIPDAPHRFSTGQEVTIDGDQGTVLVRLAKSDHASV